MNIYEQQAKTLRDLAETNEHATIGYALRVSAQMLDDLSNSSESSRHYIDRFEDVEQIQECAKYYVQLLGLQDWRIIYKYAIPSNPDWAGECECIHEEKSACITIDCRMPGQLWFKQPQELVLIHELIHCKISMHANDDLAGAIVSMYEHTLVDDWARSVFYARYNLTHNDMYFDADRR